MTVEDFDRSGSDCFHAEVLWTRSFVEVLWTDGECVGEKLLHCRGSEAVGGNGRLEALAEMVRIREPRQRWVIGDG
jgi:hypothetical protein